MKRTMKFLLATAAVGGVVFAGSMAFAGPGMWGWGGGPGNCPYAQQGWGGPGMMGGQGWNNPGMQGGPGWGNPGMQGGPAWGGPAAAQASIEDVLNSAKTKLAIRVDQEEAWNGYVKAVTGRIESRKALRESMNPQTMREMSAEDRLAFMQGMHETRAQGLKAQADSEKALLAVLDDDQKKAAVTLLSGGFGRQALAQRGQRGHGHRGWQQGGPGMGGWR